MQIGYFGPGGHFVVDGIHEGDVLVVGTRRGWGKLRRPQLTGLGAVIDTALHFRESERVQPKRELDLKHAGDAPEVIVAEFMTRHGIDLTNAGKLVPREAKEWLKMHSLLLGQRLFVFERVQATS